MPKLEEQEYGTVMKGDTITIEEVFILDDWNIFIKYFYKVEDLYEWYFTSSKHWY